MYKAICNFIDDLDSMYGEQISSLKYYNVLVTENDVEEEQVRIFKEWITKHEDDILILDKSKFEGSLIKHTDQVYIDLFSIMNMATPQDNENIFKHLLLLLSKVNPDTNAKSVLKTLCEPKPKTSENFIMDLVQDISQTIDIKDQDPANVDIGSVLNKIISSGAMTKIFSSVHDAMASGNIDVADLIKTTQTFASNSAKK
jgi:hypothetical protein